MPHLRLLLLLHWHGGRRQRQVCRQAQTHDCLSRRAVRWVKRGCYLPCLCP